MARQEVPKEDLIAQATALVRRMEFRTGPDAPLVVVWVSEGRISQFLFWGIPGISIQYAGRTEAGAYRKWHGQGREPQARSTGNENARMAKYN